MSVSSVLWVGQRVTIAGDEGTVVALDVSHGYMKGVTVRLADSPKWWQIMSSRPTNVKVEQTRLRTRSYSQVRPL